METTTGTGTETDTDTAGETETEEGVLLDLKRSMIPTTTVFLLQTTLSHGDGAAATADSPTHILRMPADPLPVMTGGGTTEAGSRPTEVATDTEAEAEAEEDAADMKISMVLMTDTRPILTHQSDDTSDTLLTEIERKTTDLPEEAQAETETEAGTGTGTGAEGDMHPDTTPTTSITISPTTRPPGSEGGQPRMRSLL